MEGRVLPRQQQQQQERNCENGEISVLAHVRDPRDKESGEFAVNEMVWGCGEMSELNRSRCGTIFTRETRRDIENGELIETNVCVIRKPPSQKQTFRMPNGATNRNMSLMPYALVKEQQRFGGGGFRIHNMIQNGGGLRLRKGDMVYRRNVDFPAFPMFQTCIQLDRGVVVRRTTEPAKPVHPSLGIVARKSNLDGREIFHVPEHSLPPGHFEEQVKDPHSISINIWQEFLYGKSILNDHLPEQRTKNDWTANTLRLFLERFIPATLVNSLLYSAFFILYFFAACFYNNYVELLTYALLLDHLKIHERANATNVNVEFSGSLFQGPLYALLRNWCEHCNQKERAKVVTRLMKKMKQDITAGKTKESKAKT